MASPAPAGLLTASRFAWTCIGAPAHEPPEPRRGKPRYGTHPLCWLCGGITEGRGWPRAVAIAPTFTNHNLAACPASDTVCEPCAYFAWGDGWRAYCAARPDLALKSVPPLSWRSYSHVFAPSEPGGHRCPTRRQWRALLLDPPDPPFLLVIAESGQKHVLFRGRVAGSRDVYPVQVEEDTPLVERARLADCIDLFEALLHLGFTRDEVATGRYAPHRTLAAGREVWQAAETRMAAMRARRPHDVRLAHFAAHGPKQTAAQPNAAPPPDGEETAA